MRSMHRPGRLVNRWSYRWFRNPMYVGLCLVYLGLALVMKVWWAIVLFPLVVLGLDRLIIRREDRHFFDALSKEPRDE